MRNIHLPGSGGTPGVELKDVTSLVLFGANGSGKTRLGVYLEEAMAFDTHRVSAQRALVLPDQIPTRSLADAHQLLRFGTTNLGSQLSQHSIRFRFQTRWQDDPFAAVLEDFQLVLTYLFAVHAKHAMDFRDAYKKGTLQPKVPETELERTLDIWHEFMPQRELLANDNVITAGFPAGNSLYASKHLSDGEKVCLYLIAQCLAPPPNTVIIIDEPELHINEAIQARLWDRIEEARKDCVFVYITHSLNFAASRTAATKIWVKSYDHGNIWHWEDVTDQFASNRAFPEDVAFRVLGSRQNILFVEGEAASLDAIVYRHLYPNWFVVPRGSCRSVIDGVVAFRSLPQLHRHETIGIIDRDHRSEAEIASYAKHGVYATEVAEIENLLLIPEAIKAVSQQLKRDPAADLAEVERFLFAELSKDLAIQVNARSVFQVQQQLNKYGGMKKRKGTENEFVADVESFLKTIDPGTIRKNAEATFDSILQQRDYRLLLKHYNGGGLPQRVAVKLDLRPDAYPQMVLRLIAASDGESLRAAMRTYLPPLPTK